MNPFEEEQRKAGWVGPQAAPSELARQLGFALSYGAPDFRGGRGGGGDQFEGQIADIVSGKAARDAQKGKAYQSLVGSEIAQEKALGKAQIPLGGVVDGKQRQFAPNPASMLKFMAGQAEQQRQLAEDPAAFEADLNRYLSGITPDVEVTPEMLEYAEEDPRFEQQLTRTTGAARQQAISAKSGQLAKTAIDRFTNFQDLADPYSSDIAAGVAFRTNPQLTPVADVALRDTDAKSMMKDDRERGLLLDMASNLPELDLSDPVRALEGDEVEVPAYRSPKPDPKTGVSPDYMQATNALLGGGAFKWGNRSLEWRLTNPKSDDELQRWFSYPIGPNESGGQIQQAIAASADEDGKPTLDENDLMRAIEAAASGVPADAKLSPLAIKEGRRIWDATVQRYKGRLFLADPSTREIRPVTPDGKWREGWIGTRKFRTGEIDGQPTLAKQYGLTEDRAAMGRAARVLSKIAEAKIGGMDEFVRDKMDEAILKRGIADDETRQSLIREALPAMRRNLLSSGALQDVERDREGFWSKTAGPQFKKFLDGRQVPDNSGLSTEGREFANRAQAQTEMDTEQDLMAAPADDPELIELLNMGQRQPQQGGDSDILRLLGQMDSQEQAAQGMPILQNAKRGNRSGPQGIDPRVLPWMQGR